MPPSPPSRFFVLEDCKTQWQPRAEKQDAIIMHARQMLYDVARPYTLNPVVMAMQAGRVHMNHSGA
jgi:hypothetical protein